MGLLNVGTLDVVSSQPRRLTVSEIEGAVAFGEKSLIAVLWIILVSFENFAFNIAMVRDFCGNSLRQRCRGKVPAR
jgi:hypothetical protein